MKEHKFVMGRIINFLYFIYAAVMAFICIAMGIAGTVPEQFGPIAFYVVPSIHVVTSIVLVFLIFKENLFIKFALFQIESCVAIYTGFEAIGMFLFYSSIFIIYIFYFSSNNNFFHILGFFILHIFFLIIDPSASFETKCINIPSTFFMMFMFIYFYEILQDKFSSFVPKAIVLSSNINDKNPGDIVKLSDYKLTERQINFVYDYIMDNLTYNDLAKKYFVSLSTVKKEFADVYKILGVSKLSELKILLLQFKIQK